MKPTEQILLRDESTKPTDKVLEKALEIERFALYLKLRDIITHEFNLDMQWRFYNDGKAWLCKVVSKKKTILWLSVWEGFIRTSFYFTKKTRPGVLELEIDKKIKRDFKALKPTGKLIPLIVHVVATEQLDDVSTIIRYKVELK